MDWAALLAQWRAGPWRLDGSRPRPLPALYPRGLINRNQSCFVNAVVQGLCSCDAFVALAAALPRDVAGRGLVFVPSLARLAADLGVPPLASRVHASSARSQPASGAASGGGGSTTEDDEDGSEAEADPDGTLLPGAKDGGQAAPANESSDGCSKEKAEKEKEKEKGEEERKGQQKKPKRKRRGGQQPRVPDSGPVRVAATTVRRGRGGKANAAMQREPLFPSALDVVVHNFRLTTRGSQADAQEFCAYWLDALHSEMVRWSAARGVSLSVFAFDGAAGELEGRGGGGSGFGGGDNDDDDGGGGGGGGWEEVGARNRKRVVRDVNEMEFSPVALAFGGRTRTVVEKAGGSSHDSVTYQPFLTLPLELQDGGRQVTDLEGAFRATFRGGAVDGFTHRERAVRVTLRLTLDRLPPVLVLHLKRFGVRDGRPYKVSRHVAFAPAFSPPAGLLSPGSRRREYSLVAVVVHDGAAPDSGHYVTYARRGARWLRFDDSEWREVSLRDVTEQQAYVLIYESSAVS